MAFTGGNDVVQQITPTTLHPPLYNPILPRTLDRGPNRTDGHRAHRGRNLQAILGIPVEDEKSRSRLIGESFPQLLHDPSAGGMWCDVEMQHASAVVADDEKAAEHTESDRGDRKEIHGGNGFAMVSQKGEPTFGWLGISGRSAHPAGDGPLGDIEA